MKQFIWLDNDIFRVGPNPPDNKIVVDVTGLPLTEWDQDMLEHYFDIRQKQVV
jgi:hypothetical protein